MRKIKILEIIGDSTFAGAPRHLLNILQNLDEKKFSFFVISPPGPLAGEIRSLKQGIELEIVPMASKLDWKSIFQIRTIIKHLKPDIIHVHGTRAGSLGRLASVGLGIPVIYTEHLWTKHFRLSNRLNETFQIAGLWFLDLFTTLNIAVSQAVKDFMVSSQISREEKIIVIYNATKVPDEPAKIFSRKNFRLGTVATLGFHKGVQYLIGAMPKILAEFPQTTLEIIGDGEYRKPLEKLTKKMKLEKNIIFSGFVKDVNKSLKNFDIYIQPSLSESFGLAIIQAMSLGIPIIASNTGGIPEVVTTGKSGLLVEAGKPQAISVAIIAMLRDPKRAKDMGELAREEVKIKFNMSDFIDEMEQVYETLAKSRT